MSRYIDAEIFAKDLQERWTTANKNAEKELSNIISSLVVPILIGVPTADVEEVKHGKWIGNKNSGDVFCSNCDWNIDTFYHHIDITEFEYCPSCKIKMDLE